MLSLSFPLISLEPIYTSVRTAVLLVRTDSFFQVHFVDVMEDDVIASACDEVSGGVSVCVNVCVCLRRGMSLITGALQSFRRTRRVSLWDERRSRDHFVLQSSCPRLCHSLNFDSDG